MANPFTKATKKKSKARVGIAGPAGSGKTFTSLVAATVLAQGGKIAVIDTERGSASLYSDKFNFDVLELDTYSPTRYVEAIEAAEAAGYAVIVIDSLSHAWEGEGGELDLVDKAASRMQGNSHYAWKEVTPLHRRLVDAMLGSPCHLVVTMRSKMEYVQEKDERGKTVVKKVGMAPVMKSGMEYEFTFVGDMDTEHKFVVSKSRCDALADAVLSKPDGKFFQKFLDWLNSGEDAPTPAKQESTPAPVQKGASAPAPKVSPEPTLEWAKTITVNGGTLLTTLTEDQLTKVMLTAKTPETQKAAQMILDDRAAAALAAQLDQNAANQESEPKPTK